MTRIEYSAPVIEGVMDTRLGPLSDGQQHWECFELRASPMAAVRQYTDGFGNGAHLITVAGPHDFIEVTTQGVAQTLLANPFTRPEHAPPPLRPLDLADYLGPSDLIPRHPELDALAARHRPDDPAATFEAVQALMGVVYHGFTYRQHVTGVATTVPEVLKGRTGVCQDFAQVLIGLCRSIGIPARYVSGYIVTSGQSQTQRSGSGFQSQSQSRGTHPTPDRGAGASHAWIEAYTPTHGWRGFDPTNNLVASENHIKMAIGRDYSDIPPTRGTFRGAADEKLTVDVSTQRLG